MAVRKYVPPRIVPRPLSREEEHELLEFWRELRRSLLYEMTIRQRRLKPVLRLVRKDDG